MSGLALLHTRTHVSRWLLGAALILAVPAAEALEVTLTAQYRGGGSGRFENTTPPARLCHHWSTLCKGGTTVELPISYVKRSINKAPDLRDRYYLQLPARREVDVYHEQTGEPRRMVFEFNRVAQLVTSANTNLNPLNGAFEGGCGTGDKISTRTAIRFHSPIREPQSPRPCSSSYSWAADGRVEISSVEEMGVGYTLDLPPPYRLRTGIYRGSLTYSIGSGGDFDFGNDVTALSGNSLTINFELTVEHAFVFEFAPGSERAVLEPPGGWNAWLSGRRIPQRIYRDLPFRLWSTGPFKVYKLCQYRDGDRCGIRSDGNDQVPVEVALSLPGGIRYQGREVSRLALPTGSASALQFDSVMPTLNRPGQLHFEVAGDDVRGMLAHAGSTYTGQVTVVFDAEL